MRTVACVDEEIRAVVDAWIIQHGLNAEEEERFEGMALALAARQFEVLGTIDYPEIYREAAKRFLKTHRCEQKEVTDWRDTFNKRDKQKNERGNTNPATSNKKRATGKQGGK